MIFLRDTLIVAAVMGAVLASAGIVAVKILFPYV